MFDSSKKDEMLNLLVSKTKELGRRPSFTEVREDKDMPDPNDYAYHFRSFTDAAEIAWRGYESSTRKGTLAIKKTIKPIKNIRKPG